MSQENHVGARAQTTFFGSRIAKDVALGQKRGSLQDLSSLEGDRRIRAPMFITNEMINDYGNNVSSE